MLKKTASKIFSISNIYTRKSFHPFRLAKTNFTNSVSSLASDFPTGLVQQTVQIVVRSSHNLTLFVVHVVRGSVIRLISARSAITHERNFTRKIMATKQDKDMLDDFSNGVRGKYALQYQEGTNIIKLDEDVRKIFPDVKAVNAALRSLAGIIKQHERTT